MGGRETLPGWSVRVASETAATLVMFCSAFLNNQTCRRSWARVNRSVCVYRACVGMNFSVLYHVCCRVAAVERSVERCL